MKSQQVQSPIADELLAKADEGDREALARVYAQAGAWLREGRPLPPGLSEWLGERLAELGSLIHDRRRKDASRSLPVEAARILRIQRKGKSGRPPSRLSERVEKALAGDVAHFVEWRRMKPEAAFDAVEAMHESMGKTYERDQIKAAWHRFKEMHRIS